MTDKEEFQHKIYLTVGEFLSKWIAVEYCIDLTIARYFVHPDDDRIADLETFINRAWKLDNKLNLLRHALIQKSPERKKLIIALINRIVKLKQQRDLFAHRIIDLGEAGKDNFKSNKLIFTHIGNYGGNKSSAKAGEYDLAKHHQVMRKLHRILNEFDLYLNTKPDHKPGSGS